MFLAWFLESCSDSGARVIGADTMFAADESCIVNSKLLQVVQRKEHSDTHHECGPVIERAPNAPCPPFR